MSNPKAAALTFTKALENGDPETAKLAADAGGLELDLIDAMAQSASGIKRLEDASVKKFGEDSRRLIQPVPVNVTKNLATGEVDQNAERATIRSRDGRDKIQLKREGAVWKVDVGALIRGQDISKVIPLFRAAGSAGRAVADDIESGKCKSVEEARRQMAMRIGTELPRLLNEAATMPSEPAEPVDAPQEPVDTPQ